MKRITLTQQLLVLVPLLCALTNAGARAEDGPNWMVGAGRCKITPTEPIWMAGYAGRSAPSDGTTTDLWAKALVLDDGQGNRGVIVSLDLVGIDRELSVEICQRLGNDFDLERSQIVLCTSHTHSGPVAGKKLMAMYDALLDESERAKVLAYSEKLPGLIAVGVGEAIGNLEPSRVQWGSGHSSFAVNRRENKSTEIPALRASGELKGPVDHDVPVLSVRSLARENELTAIMFGYACHATSVSFNRWSGDYPGYAQIELEKAHPNAVALFWAGCGADQNPLPRRTVAYAEQYGAELARAVNATLNSPMSSLEPKLDLAYREITLKLQQLPDPAKLAEAEKSQNRFEVARARYLQRELMGKGAVRENYPYPVGYWKLGSADNGVQFIHLGGETVVDYALRLKGELRGKHTWVAGYCNDVMTYIPSLRVLREGGYEGGGANVYFGMPGLWDESVEDAIVGAVREMSW